MTQNRDFFKPDRVDEQVDQISQNLLARREQMGKPAQAKTASVKEDSIQEPQAGARQMVEELETFYQATHQQNRDFLEHAWQRIAAHPSASSLSAHKQSAPILQMSQKRTGIMQSQHITNNPKGKTIYRTMSLVAAVLVAVLLVGTAVTVLTLNHNNQSSQTGAVHAATATPLPTATPTPLPAGSIVYTRSHAPGMILTAWAAWSPDSKRLATLTGPQNGTTLELQISDATTGAHLLRIPLSEYTGTIQWSPDGKYLSMYSLTAITILDGRTGKVVHIINANTLAAVQNPVAQQSLLARRFPESRGSHFITVTWTPDSTSLAVTFAGKVELLNPLTGAVKATLTTTAPFPLLNPTFSGDGQYLAATYSDSDVTANHIVVWKVSTRAVVLQQNNLTVESLAWQPGTHNLLEALSAPAVEGQLWNLDTKKLSKTYNGIGAFTWSPDGKQLATYASSSIGDSTNKTKPNEITIIDANSGAQVALYKSPNSSFGFVYWSPDGRYIASTEALSLNPSDTGYQIVVWIA